MSIYLEGGAFGMKYFLDTEFIEDGITIDLISIGIVCEDGRELYMQNKECNFLKASDWVRMNVLCHLEDFSIKNWEPKLSQPYGSCTYRPWYEKSEIASEVIHFTRSAPYRQNPEKPEFWGYYADYDWVVFCQLFGTMVDLPKGFPMYMNDIKQLCNSVGNPILPEQGKGEHNALLDARWNKKAYEFLQGIVKPQEVEGE